MKKIKKRILIITALLLLIAGAGGFIYRYHLINRALPDYNKDITLKDLKGNVKVYRDKHAIPHIYANNAHDLYMTTGYILAQDRLWQMDLMRRVTTGRVSEIVGKKALKMDILMRALQLSKKSKEIIEQSDPEIINAVKAFTKGVNKYIKNNKSNLPKEFTILDYKPKPWKLTHSVNLIGYMAWDLTPNFNGEILLERIKQNTPDSVSKQFYPFKSSQSGFVYPDYKPDSTSLSSLNVLKSYRRIIHDLGLNVFSGSNNWAISGKKSKTGKPMLANDMHLGLNMPGIWYQIHQVIKGEMNVTGVLLPGQPMVISGHNQSIAWGLTNVMVDNIDFYREKVHPDDSNKYLYNGKYKDMKISKELIPVKDQKPVKQNIRYTRHGPIVSDWNKNLKKQKPVSIKWIGNNLYSNELRSVYLLNRASDWAEFKNAISSFKAVSQNIAYADTAGNIGMYCAAGIPERKNKQGYLIAPGWTDKYNWTGYVPFDSLPHEYNPERGFVVSANNPTASDFPYYIGSWFAPGYRFNRIKKMLSRKSKLSVSDFKEIQTDQKSMLAQKVVPELLKTLENQKESLKKIEKNALNLLYNWNYQLDKNSNAALVFQQFIISFLKKTTQDELDDLYKDFAGNRIFSMNIWEKLWNNKSSSLYDIKQTDKKETFSVIVLKAFQHSVKKISEQYGMDMQKWAWGDLHQLKIYHPLGRVKGLNWVFDYNTRSWSVGGGRITVAPTSFSLNNPQETDHGASQRHIYTIGNWEASQTVLPTGISGKTGSSFYGDQTDLYVKGKYHKDFFSKRKVKKNAIFKMNFLPR